MAVRAVPVEAIALVSGFLCLVVAVSTMDWRLGLAVFGVGLILSAMEPPRVRR